MNKYTPNREKTPQFQFQTLTFKTTPTTILILMFFILQRNLRKTFFDQSVLVFMLIKRELGTIYVNLLCFVLLSMWVIVTQHLPNIDVWCSVFLAPLFDSMLLDLSKMTEMLK